MPRSRTIKPGFWDSPDTAAAYVEPAADVRSLSDSESPHESPG
ncbi:MULTISPECIES: hypothetical protein [Nocardia]|nr:MULTISPECIES: hypothetical protein [Nocardia]